MKGEGTMRNVLPKIFVEVVLLFATLTISSHSLATVVAYTDEASFQSAANKRFTLLNLDAPPLNAHPADYWVEEAGPSSTFKSLGVDFLVNAKVFDEEAFQIPKAGRERLIAHGAKWKGNLAFDLLSPANGVGVWSNFIDGGRIKAYDGRGLTGNLLGVASLNGGSFGGLISTDAVVRSVEITCDFNWDLDCGLIDIQFGSTFTFDDVIKDAVAVTVSGPKISAKFQPKFGLTLAETAKLGGYDHFNWYQTVEKFPHSETPNWLTTSGISPSFEDPPPGYLTHPLMVDSLPYYYREDGDPFNAGVCSSGGWYFRSCNQGPLSDFDDPLFLTFYDRPNNPLLTGAEQMDFITELAGVRSSDDFDQLNKFTWSSNFNGGTGTAKVTTASDPNDITVGGTGGIFNLRTNVSGDIPEPNTSALLLVGLSALLLLGTGVVHGKAT